MLGIEIISFVNFQSGALLGRTNEMSYSCRGHLKRKVCMKMQAFFVFWKIQDPGLVDLEKNKKKCIVQAMQTLHFQKGVQRIMSPKLRDEKSWLSLPTHHLALHYQRSTGPLTTVRPLSRSQMNQKMIQN